MLSSHRILLTNVEFLQLRKSNLYLDQFIASVIQKSCYLLRRPLLAPDVTVTSKCPKNTQIFRGNIVVGCANCYCAVSPFFIPACIHKGIVPFMSYLNDGECKLAGTPYQLARFSLRS